MIWFTLVLNFFLLFYDLRCIASCGSNIYDHEVLTSYGQGAVTVNCSPTKYVLGCGIYPGKRTFLHFCDQAGK